MIPYCIISVKNDRLDNVRSLEKVLGENRHYPEVCDYSNKKSRLKFLSKFPTLSYHNYAKSPRTFVQENKKNGEIGCWLSHVSAWNYLFYSDITEMLIIEDDLVLTKNQLSEIFQVINYSKNFNTNIVMLGEWSACYYINKMGAKHLLSESDIGFASLPLDLYIYDTILQKRIGQIGPILAKQDPKLGSHLDFELEN